MRRRLTKGRTLKASYAPFFYCYRYQCNRTKKKNWKYDIFCLGSDYNNADVLTKSPTSVEAGKLFNIHTSDTSKQNARGQAWLVEGWVILISWNY